MEDMSHTMLNPVRIQIVQHLAVRGRITAGELQALMPAIPRTTLYRHLNKLVQANVLAVVGENRVRGTVEKVYSLNLVAIAAENTRENAPRNAFNILMKTYVDLEKYFADPNSNPEKDRIFLNQVVLQLSDSEYDAFLSELAHLVQSHMQRDPSAERRPRNLLIVSGPSME